MKRGDPKHPPEDAARPGAESTRPATAPPAAGKPAELAHFKPTAPAQRPAAHPAAPASPPRKQFRMLVGPGRYKWVGLPPPGPATPAARTAPAGATPLARHAPQAQPAARQEARKGAPPRKRLKLTDRDRQLMGLLAMVRYLTREQLQRLMFAERDGINLHKRLLALAGEGKYGVEQPYLKKLEYRNWLGEPQTAWMLTPLGYNVAETVLGTPPRRPSAEVGANFIEHGLFANELYVQLLEAPLKQALAAARARAQHEERPSRSFTRQKAGLYARASHPALRWHSHDEVRLPWKTYEKGALRDRVIIPDATLELPGRITLMDQREQPHSFPGLRCFLEAETGSQTVAPEGDTKPGATLNKLDRYATYLAGFAGRPTDGDYSTWYTKAYPDGFEPTLLFMVKDAGRAAVVTNAIEQWQRQPNQPAITALALTVEGAADWLLSMLGSTWAAAAPGARTEPRQKAPRVINSAEYNVLNGYTKSSHALHQRSRADARSRGEVPPEYPEETDAMNALLAKLHR